MLKSLWLYLATAIALALVFLAMQTPAPAPVDSPASVFSAGRAMEDVRAIAQRPHPTGSAEIGKVRAYLQHRLQEMGLGGEIHAGQGASVNRVNKSWLSAGSVQNIVGILPGMDRSRPAVLVMAHYDTVTNSPGAADDTLGVAATLEIARLLKAGKRPLRDVIFLFTDGEEGGLLGAQAFFATDPLADHVGVVINLEARGDAGRAMMFQTGLRSGPLVARMAEVAAGLNATSMAASAYQRMPNDTDLTQALRRGLPGLNFAILDDILAYHTPLSTLSHLAQGSLQHLGNVAAPTVRAVADMPTLPDRIAPGGTGSTDAKVQRGDDDLVYGDLLGLTVVRYPAPVGWVVLGAAVALTLAAGYLCVRRGKVRAADIARGAGGVLMLLLAGALFLGLLGQVLGLPSYYRTFTLDGHGAAFLTSVICGLLASGVAVYWALSRGTSAWEAWLGALALSSVAAVGIQLFDPALGPPFAWPLLLAAVAALACALVGEVERGRGLIAATLIVIPGLAFGFSIGAFLFTAIGESLPVANLLTVVMVAPLMAPLLHAAGAGVLGRWVAAGLAVVAVAAGLLTGSGPSPARPGLTEAFYLADPAQKLWVRASRQAPTDWSRKVLAPGPGQPDKQVDPPFLPVPFYAAPAPHAAVSLPLVAAQRLDGRLMLSAAPTRNGERLVLMFRPTRDLAHLRLNGRIVDFVLKANTWTTISYDAPPPEGVTVAVDAADHASVAFVCAEQAPGWPRGLAPSPRPADLMGVGLSDYTVAIARLDAAW